MGGYGDNRPRRRLTTSSILAVTTRSDITADAVILAAERIGVSVFRFNTEDYPTEVQIEYRPGYPGAAALLASDGRRIEIAAATGIWIRRPQWPVISQAIVSDADRRIAFDESVAAMAALWRTVASKCISPPDAIQSARWKPAQLARALDIGFAVPDTLVTNSPDTAQAFAAQGSTVIKAVGDARVITADGILAGGTLVADAVDWSLVAYAPALLQRRIFGQSELRVTCIDGECLAVRITPPQGSDVDIRNTDPTDCSYQVVDLTHELADRCRAFLTAYGLRFGAFDFKEDGDGQPWFLECNPAGQWLWLEAFVDIPITATLVRALAGLD